MAKFSKMTRVVSLRMELEMEELDYLILFLDKARTQMINDGSNTAANMTALTVLEQQIQSVLR